MSGHARALLGLLLLAVLLHPGEAESRRARVLKLPPPSAIPEAEPPPAGESAPLAPVLTTTPPAPAPTLAPPPTAAPTPAPPAAARPARPQPSDEAPLPEAKDRAQRRPRLRVTVLPFPAAGVGEDRMVPLLRDLSEALLRNGRLDMRDLDVRLSDFAQEVPVDQVDLARATLQRGLDSMHNLELPRAVTQLQDAVDQMVVVLPYVRKQELADAMLALAVAQAQRGNRRASNAALVRLLTWRSDYELDAKRYPPAFAASLEDARRAVQRLARGSVRVQSDPPGAQVFIDGRYVGVTPLEADALLAGEHFVTFKKIGYKKGLRIAQVGSRSSPPVTARLERSEKYLLVKQAMDRLSGALGAQRLDPTVDTLRETLYLDHAVLLRAAPAQRPGALQLTAYLYDLRTRQLLRRQELPLEGTGTEAAAAKLADGLYAGVDYDNVLRPPPEPPPPPPVTRTPLYRKWWFLTAAGAIAAGVVGIGLGVGLTRPGACPDGNVCTGRLQY